MFLQVLWGFAIFVYLSISISCSYLYMFLSSQTHSQFMPSLVKLSFSALHHIKISFRFWYRSFCLTELPIQSNKSTRSHMHRVSLLRSSFRDLSFSATSRSHPWICQAPVIGVSITPITLANTLLLCQFRYLFPQVDFEIPENRDPDSHILRA